MIFESYPADTLNFTQNYKDYTFKYSVIKLFEAVSIIRLLRLSIYLYEIKTFRIIVEALKSLLVPF